LTLGRERQADSVLLSPLDGYVVSRELEPGTTVNPGTPVLKIADPKSAWVTVHVDERETSGIRVGDPAEITLRSVPGRTLRGRVARVQRESDRVTEQLAVDIAFEERPPRLTLGEQAEATIRPAGRSQVVALPLSALIRTPDGLGVWVVVDGRLQFRTIRLGMVDPAGWVEILEGARPGDHVVVAPGRLADRGHEGRRVLATPVTDGTTQAQSER
jgi:HlyD family secretion protein